MGFRAVWALALSLEITDSLAADSSLKNWGLANSQAKSHVSALEAWTVEQGRPEVVVAVIDTGLDARHPDLQKNLFRHRDGSFGWNFVSGRSDPRDDHGHGTHVAGIIGATTNWAAGVSGVAPNVTLLPVKYFESTNTGSTNLQHSVSAIYYAISRGEAIINYSGGGPDFSIAEYRAIKSAESAGILVVAAAGNERQDSDKEGQFYYPAAYDAQNVITVAAIDIKNNLTKSSNWGKRSVDLAAPGENIFSTLPNGRYGYMSGTSQATAFVSGAAALLKSHDPSLSPAEIKEILMSSVDKTPQLLNKVASDGKLNTYSALQLVKSRKNK